MNIDDSPRQVGQGAARIGRPGRGASRRLGALLVLGSLGWAGAAQAADAASTARAGGAPATMTVSKVGLPPVSATIYWAVRGDGRVEMSDRPLAGAAVQQGVERLRTSVSQQDVVRARKQQAYWREQSEAFTKRHRERQASIDKEREARALAQVERTAYAASPYYIVPGYGYGPSYGWGFPVPPVPPGNGPGIAVNGTFQSAQQAALGGGPSPFLSSGFARDLRR